MSEWTSNAEWTKIGRSTDTHTSREAAQAICDALVDRWGAGKPPCEIRGNCKRSWVEGREEVKVDEPKKEENKKESVKLYRNPLNRGKYRNDPCPCGSGKKIKKCHGVKASVTRSELDSIITMVNNFNKRFKDAVEAHSKAEMERLSKGDLSGQTEQTENI